MFNSQNIVINAGYTFLHDFVERLPDIFPKLANTIYARRNILKKATEKDTALVIKSFQTPHLLNRIIYSNFRNSKARRSYEYALKLRDLGINTPQPIGYYEEKHGLLFSSSYYVCCLSPCRHTINDLVLHTDFPERESILADLALFTARLHENGILHLDYSAENILMDRKDGKTMLELVDLNRMRFCHVGISAGCRNFERLNLDADSLQLLAKVYAQARHFDEETCVRNILKMRWHKHQK